MLGSMENLPLEIISEILSRLPFETMLQCKHVCKTWKKLLDHVHVGTLFAIGSVDHEKYSQIQLFYTAKDYDGIDYDGEVDVKKQYSWYEVSKYRLNYPYVRNWFKNDILVGSCNGLVCLAVVLIDIHEPIFVFNPFIPNELINLPPIRTSNMYYEHRLVVTSGFGYARSTDEYKVIRIVYSDDDDAQPLYVGQVEVYTIGSGYGWRNKGEISYCLCNSPGVHIDGVLHWLDYREWKIVAFDIVTEEFRVLPSPPCFWLTEVISSFSVSSTFEFLADNFQLHVLGGFLCVIHKNKGERLDIWALKKDRKDHIYEWVWSKEFTMECLEKNHTYEPFAITKNNKLLLWYDKYILLCYDPKMATLGKLNDYVHVGRDVIRYYQVIPHMMKTSVSVVALERSVYQSKKQNPELGRITWLEPWANLYSNILRKWM